MNIEVLDAKNGEKTLKVDSLFFHSSYDPSKEAERFVSSLEIPFNPKKIVIIEPGLSYCLPFLKQKYPDCKFGFIKLTQEFPSRNGFDFELDFLNNQDNFDFYLTSKFTENDFFNTFFVSWPASSKVFQNENVKIWLAIKSATEKIKTVLITREYFEKKWLINSVNLLKHLDKISAFTNQIDKPILICASGPSLKSNLKAIYENQKSFFIIALSSAVSVLTKNKISPDLVFSTDGGFWAGEHLKKCKNQTIALPLESYCPKHIFKSNRIMPLVYQDGLSSILAQKLLFQFEPCQRNGTVSGSALEFALLHSNHPVYFFGLDLSSQTGFQHTQPNELEVNNSYKDNRLKTKEKRLYPSSLKNYSLEVYEDWFKNQNFPENRIFRVIDKAFKKNSLGKIIDISSSAFLNQCKLFKNDQKQNYFSEKAIQITSNKNTDEYLKETLYQLLQDEENQKQLLPLSFVLLSHLEKNPDQFNLQKSKIDKELNKLVIKLDKILNG